MPGRPLSTAFPPGPAEGGHLPALDGLRGLAVAVVVVSHLANAGMLPAILGQGFGQMGVALFYALSGFLMARLHLGAVPTRDSLLAYAWRRGARVLPLYLAALALGVAMLGLGLSPYRLEDAADVWRAAFLVHGTGVLWSVPTEIQFYVVFAGLWVVARRGHLAAALAGLLAVQALAVLALVAAEGPPNTYNLAFWMHFFLAGVVLGHLSTHPAMARLRRAATAHANRSALAVAALLAGALLAPPGMRDALGLPHMPPFADPYSAGYPMALLVAALVLPGAGRAFSWGPLRWLGKVSFSVYLFHMPVLVVVAAAGPDWLSPWNAAVLTVAGTLAVATLTERVIETGLRRAILRHAPA